MLILGRRHLARVLKEHVEHYNRERPHRGLDLTTRDGHPDAGRVHGQKIGRCDRLGGRVHAGGCVNRGFRTLQAPSIRWSKNRYGEDRLDVNAIPGR